MKALKAGNVSSGDLARGKELLKAAVLVKNNTDEGLIAELGHQCAVHGGAINTTDAVAAIDALTSADVNAVRMTQHYNYTLKRKLVINIIRSIL